MVEVLLDVTFSVQISTSAGDRVDDSMRLTVRGQGETTAASSAEFGNGHDDSCSCYRSPRQSRDRPWALREV
jgi:hypothetical protein